uniref:Cell division protein n=1 Tax=Chloroparvula sp. RCC999 TaxID=2565276 RepID=A0A4D6C3B8_9CHLO|nr:cell division protein [Chloroparvula sp. RCC999]
MSSYLYYAKSLGSWLTRFKSFVNSSVNILETPAQEILYPRLKAKNDSNYDSIEPMVNYLLTPRSKMVSGKLQINKNELQVNQLRKKVFKSLVSLREKQQHYITYNFDVYNTFYVPFSTFTVNEENPPVNSQEKYQFFEPQKIDIKCQSIKSIKTKTTNKTKKTEPSFINKVNLPINPDGRINSTNSKGTLSTFDWYSNSYNPKFLTQQGYINLIAQDSLSNDRIPKNSSWLSNQTIHSYGCWLGLSTFWDIQDEVINEAVLELVGDSEQSINNFLLSEDLPDNFNQIKSLLIGRINSLGLSDDTQTIRNYIHRIALETYKEKLTGFTKKKSNITSQSSGLIKQQLDSVLNLSSEGLSKLTQRSSLLTRLRKHTYNQSQNKLSYGLPNSVINRLNLFSANFDFDPYKYNAQKQKLESINTIVQNKLVYSSGNYIDQEKLAWPRYLGRYRFNSNTPKIKNPYNGLNNLHKPTKIRRSMWVSKPESVDRLTLPHSQMLGLTGENKFTKKGQKTNIHGNWLVTPQPSQFINLPILYIWCHAGWVFGLLTISLTFSPFLQRRKNSRTSVLGGKNYNAENENWLDSLNLPAGYKNQLVVNKFQQVTATLMKFISGSYSLVPVQSSDSIQFNKNARSKSFIQSLSAHNRIIALKLVISLRVLYRSFSSITKSYTAPKGLLIITPNNNEGQYFAQVVANESKMQFIQIDQSFQDASPVAQLELLAWYGKVYSKTKSPCVVFIQNIDTYGLRSMPSQNFMSSKVFNWQTKDQNIVNRKPNTKSEVNLIKSYKPWAQQSRKIFSALYNRPTDDKSMESDSSVNVTFSPSYGIIWDYALNQVTQMQQDSNTNSSWINPNLIRKDDSINRMLAALDGVSRGSRLHVFATASNFNNVDPALTRYGRLSEVVFIKPRSTTNRTNSNFNTIQQSNIVNKLRLVTQNLDSTNGSLSSEIMLKYKQNTKVLRPSFNLNVGNTAHGYDLSPQTPLMVALEHMINFNQSKRVEVLYKVGSHWVVPAWWQVQTREPSECLPNSWMPCLTEPSLNTDLGQAKLPAVIGQS